MKNEKGTIVLAGGVIGLIAAILVFFIYFFPPFTLFTLSVFIALAFVRVHH